MLLDKCKSKMALRVRKTKYEQFILSYKELRVSWKSRFCFKTECKMAGSRNGHVLHNYLNTLTRSLYITVTVMYSDLVSVLR